MVVWYDAPPLGLKLGVPGLYEDVGVTAEPEEGQDGAAAPAHRGVQLDTPERQIISGQRIIRCHASPDVGREAGTPEQDGHLVITSGARAAGHTPRPWHQRSTFLQGTNENDSDVYFTIDSDMKVALPVARGSGLSSAYAGGGTLG